MRLSIIFAVRMVSMSMCISSDNFLRPRLRENLVSCVFRVKINLFVRPCIHNIPLCVFWIAFGSSFFSWLKIATSNSSRHSGKNKMFSFLLF